MKHLEGKEVYLRYTGNHARSNSKKWCKAKIIKVARVFITFIKEGSIYQDKWRYDDNRLDSDCNSGYVIYETKKELDDYFLSNELSSKITDKYQYKRNYMELDIEILKQIAELLGV